MQKMQVQGRSSGDVEIVTHSSILAWKIPQTEEPGGLQSIGVQRIRYDWAQHNMNFKFLLRSEFLRHYDNKNKVKYF